METQPYAGQYSGADGADRPANQERKDTMAWTLDADRPIYSQIVEILSMQIISGVYPPGAKVPSVRELAASAGVNPNTMQKALQELERQGLMITQRTTGRNVTEDVEMIQTVRRNLAAGQVQEFLQKMKEMGFETREILDLLKTFEEEGEA